MRAYELILKSVFLFSVHLILTLKCLNHKRRYFLSFNFLIISSTNSSVSLLFCLLPYTLSISWIRSIHIHFIILHARLLRAYISIIIDATENPRSSKLILSMPPCSRMHVVIGFDINLYPFLIRIPIFILLSLFLWLFLNTILTQLIKFLDEPIQIRILSLLFYRLACCLLLWCFYLWSFLMNFSF